jgi:hypothetical protein
MYSLYITPSRQILCALRERGIVRSKSRDFNAKSVLNGLRKFRAHHDSSSIARSSFESIFDVRQISAIWIYPLPVDSRRAERKLSVLSRRFRYLAGFVMAALGVDLGCAERGVT